MSDTADMSKQHEAWIVDVLNFLNRVGAPIYRHNDRGEKQGEPYDIPARLNWVAEQMSAQKREAQRARADRAGEISKRQDRIDDLERVLSLAYNALVPEEGPCRMGEAIMMLDNVFDPGEPGLVYATQIRHPSSEVDARGVRRVKIDGRVAFLKLGVDGIIHDLDEDEAICPQCSGLGICKVESSYGKGDRKPHESAFPYRHQWLAQCPQCYMGKVKICQEPAEVHPSAKEYAEIVGAKCGKIIHRGRTVCDCPAAVASAAARREEKESARRGKLPRVKLADYRGEMLFGANTERFVDVDEIDEHVEEHPDDEFFACNPRLVACRVSAADIVEQVKEQAWDEAGPECDGDVVDFAADAEELLDKVLEAWFEVCVFPQRLHWPDMNLMVEVRRG